MTERRCKLPSCNAVLVRKEGFGWSEQKANFLNRTFCNQACASEYKRAKPEEYVTFGEMLCYEPTADKIKEECEEIRKGWDKTRLGSPSPVEVLIVPDPKFQRQ